ncbi:MAG: hypothetical protein AB7U85_09140 [Alphaproteobacteria bacterium]
MFIKKLFLTIILSLFLTMPAIAIENQLEYKSEFDETELNDFLTAWPSYFNWSQENKSQNNSDLNESSVEYPKAVVALVEANGFTVDRFFYLENRVNMAIRSCLIKKEQDKIANALRANLEKLEEGDSFAETLQEEISKSEKAHLIYGLTEDELNIVCPNLKLVEKIMFGDNFEEHTN